MPQDRKKFRLPLDEFEGLFDGFFDKKVQEILCAWRASVPDMGAASRRTRGLPIRLPAAHVCGCG